MIKRLLVANRGEIAVRIMATASVLGVDTVAVYPADDAACGHVGRADAAVELPGTGAAARCAATGIRFAGPGPEALALFGDKAAARLRSQRSRSDR